VLLAAAGLAKIMVDTPGRVLVIGTPDEERGARGMGKVGILEGGHFDATDVALITHAADRWSLDQRFLANKRTFFGFRGKSAHAAMAPHKGVNALRAVITMMNGVDSIREHLRQDVRIHGIITKGGAVVNVVPDFAEAEFSVRALDTSTMEDAFRRVVNCAKGAELISGAKLEFKEPRVYLTSPISVPPLNALMLNQIKALGVPESEIKDFNELPPRTWAESLMPIPPSISGSRPPRKGSRSIPTPCGRRPRLMKDGRRPSSPAKPLPSRPMTF